MVGGEWCQEKCSCTFFIMKVINTSWYDTNLLIKFAAGLKYQLLFRRKKPREICLSLLMILLKVEQAMECSCNTFHDWKLCPNLYQDACTMGPKMWKNLLLPG